MKKIISILLILTQTSILFADTLTFNSGVTIEGKLVQYDEDRLIFKVDEESMKDLPQETVIVFINDNTVVINNKYVKNVTENNIVVANPAGERGNKSMDGCVKVGYVSVGIAAVGFIMMMKGLSGVIG